MKGKIITFLAGAALLAGCESATNTNSNANMRNLNSNTAVVVNTNTTANTSSNANKWNSNVTREEYDKNKAEYEKNKGTSETIGQGLNDSWLWFKTKAALMTTSDLRDSTINVDVVNDVVTLKGSVATAAQKTKAEETAKGISGVKSVKNELKVQPSDSMTNQMTSGNSNTHNANKK